MRLIRDNQIHQNYIPELDGLRGIAIIMVITFHYFNPYLPIFSLGWSGVDLFFVLSGYLITSRLVLTRNKPRYFFRFYKNRALRIWPLYYGVLIGFYILIQFFVSKPVMSEFQFYKDHALSFILFFENWSFIYDFPLLQFHLQHFWSLAVEEQFYLIWPFFIYFFSKSKYLSLILYVWLISVVILRTYLFFTPHENYEFYFYNTFARMDGFIVGAILFFIHQKSIKNIPKWILYLSVILLAAGIILFKTHPSDSTFIATIGLTLIAIFYGIVMHIAIKGNFAFFRNLLKTRWLVYLGKISFGLYIFHWLVLQIIQTNIYKIPFWKFDANSTNGNLILLFISLILSIILSILSFKYYESYFLRLKRKK